MTQPIIDFGAHFHPEHPAGIHDFIEDADGSPIYSDVETVKARYRAAGIDMLSSRNRTTWVRQMRTKLLRATIHCSISLALTRCSSVSQASPQPQAE